MNKELFIFYAIGIFITMVASGIVCCVWREKNPRISLLLIYVMITASLYMPIAQYLKYSSLHFYVDFSHWLQIIRNIAISGKPLSLNQELLVPGTKNYFSVHFVPLLYLVAIPFKLWPYGETIIVVNSLFMLSAVIPLYKLALHVNKDKYVALVISVLLLWYPTFQYTILYEFEMLRFSIPIILWMLYFWEKRSIKLYFLFVVLATLVREEVGLTIMMFGIYLLLIEKERRFGLITAFIGLGAFVLIAQAIMPALRSSSDYRHIAAGSFGSFGSTFGEIIVNIVRHPVRAITAVIQPIKLANMFMFFLPLLFIPLLAPAILISTLANFGVGLLSESSTHISYMLYYLSPSVPFIFYAFIKGWPKFLEVLRFWGDKMGIPEGHSITSKATAMVLFGIVVTNIFFGPSPLALQFWVERLKLAPFRTQNFHYPAYKISDHHRKAKELEKLIPNSAIVSAHHFLHSLLFKKKAIMIYPRLENIGGNIKADYVFFDKTNNGLKSESPAFLTQEKLGIVGKDKKNWQLIKTEDGYYLYKRIGN